jgi:hypothetical protein
MMRVREFAGVAAVAMVAMGVAIGFQHYRSSVVLPESVAALLPDFAHHPLAGSSENSAAPKPIRLASAGAQIPSGILPAKIDAQNSPAAPVVSDVDPNALQADAVAQRLKDSVPSELFSYFDMYLYVSKAADGAWAQHMFVFHRASSGRLVFEESFPVSTGRERQEKYFTSTPTGLFELDPNRFDRDHRSHRWHNAPMPWAMFLDYTIHGHLAGVALHSGIHHEADLGHRASGGCVRMPPEKAEEYFKRFQAEEYGEVPVLAFDGSSTNTDGRVVREESGRPRLTSGYKVLVVIQNYPGGPAFVAVLS